MMDESASQVNYSRHLLDEELLIHLILTFRPFIFIKTFLSQVTVQVIFSSRGFLIYLLKRQEHLHLVMFCGFLYIF